MTQLDLAQIRAAPPAVRHRGPALTFGEFQALPRGAQVVATWSGGNGPWHYVVGRSGLVDVVRSTDVHVGGFHDASRITLDLPDRVPLVPFWRPYGGMVLDPHPLEVERLKRASIAGRFAACRAVKSIETREREWQFSPGNPRPPGWIAVYNAAKIGHLQSDAAELYGADAYRPPRAQAAINARLDPRGEYHDPTAIAAEYERRIGPAGMVIGLVWIARSRPLVPADLPSSFFYDAGRYAWLCESPRRFARPLTLAEVGVRKAPQCIVYVPGAPLLDALNPDGEPTT